MCETACAPSTSTRAPWRWPIATMSRTGTIVPSAFDTCDTETMRARRERVRRSVHVRVLVLVEVRQPIDDGARLLGRGGVVQPHQPAPVDAFVEDRKVPGNGCRVEQIARGTQIWRGPRRHLRRKRH